MTAGTITTLFSGGGLCDIGAIAAGLTPIRAVEYDPAISAHYASAVGPHVLTMPVQCVNWRKEERPLFGHASPVCKSFSLANSGGVELPEDIESAEGVCSFLRVLKPRFFTLENVRKYQRSESMARIRRALSECGYQWTEGVLNAADFGVPQTRERLILRAVLKGSVPPLRPTHSEKPMTAGLFDDVPLTPRWVGWYAAIEDLIDTLPSSKFADWQLKRLPVELLESVLVEMQNTVRDATLRTSAEPCHTLTASQCGRRQANIPRAILMIPNGEGSSARQAAGSAACLTANHGMDKHRAFLMDGDAAGERWDTVRLSKEPATTIKAAEGGRVFRAFLANESSTMELRAAAGSAAAQVASGRNANQRAFLVDGKPANYAGDLQIAESAAPTPTLTASMEKHPFRAWLEMGRVVSMTPRALARFQSVPDTYPLPDKASLATTIIGNGIPCLLAQRIFESLMEAL